MNFSYELLGFAVETLTCGVLHAKRKDINQIIIIKTRESSAKAFLRKTFYTLSIQRRNAARLLFKYYSIPF